MEIEMRLREKRLEKERIRREERKVRLAAIQRRLSATSPTRLGPQILTVRDVHQLPPAERRLDSIAEDGQGKLIILKLGLIRF